MPEPDAIMLADFEDEPQLSSAPISADPRPTGRPRPDPSSPPPKDTIALVVFDSDPVPPIHQRREPEQLSLPFDIGVVDPNGSAFLVVYSAGTPVNTLSPRTISIPAGEAGSSLTSLVIHSRTLAEPHPLPYLTFEFSHDIRGKHLTLRFTNAADPRSLVIEWERRNGSTSYVVPAASPAT